MLLVESGWLIGRHEVAALLDERRAVLVERSQDDAERKRLFELLERHEWDTMAMAAELGVERGTVYRWLRNLGIATLRRRTRSGKSSVSLDVR